MTATINSGGLTDDNTLTVTGAIISSNLSSVSIHVFDGSTDLGPVTIDGSGNWSLTTNPLPDGLHTFTAVATGNFFNSPITAGPVTAIVDTLPPTVAVNIVDASLSDSDNSSVVTFTFSEKVSDATFAGLASGAGITVTGGTLSALTWNAGHTAATATFTATDGNETTGSVTVDANSYTDVAGNLGSNGTASVPIDTQNPTLFLNIVDGSLNDVDNSSVVTFTFSEVPVGFDASDITASHGTVTGLTQDLVGDPSGKTYKATFTADNDFTGAGSVSVAPGSYTDAALNLGGPGSGNVTIDTLAPGMTISTDDSVLKIGDVAHLTFTLDEPATNFDVTDIVVTGGTLSNFAIVDATHYTANFTPSPQSTTAATVDVAGGTFTDVAGNDNTAAPQLIMTVDTVSAATWSLTGDTGVTEGNPASYTVHLAGTLQAGETATIHLGLTNVDTTSADYASFTTAVTTAIGARTDVSFNAGTGTLTYTGNGSTPMTDLVINLGAINDSLVEGPESYTVALTTPGTTTGAPVALGAANSVTTTITDANTTTWSLTGDTGVTEGNPASYTVHLAGTLQAGETATIHLGLTNVDTTSADYASFTTAVTTAIGARTDVSFNAGTGTLTYTGNGSTPMTDLVINLGAINDSLVEGPESYTVALTTPGTTTGAPVALGAANSVTTTITDANTTTWSLTGDTGVTEGNPASYTVHLAGTLQAGETATIHLGLTNVDTTSADYASFTTAVTTAIGARTDVSFNAGTGTLTYTGNGSTPMTDLVINLGAINDSLVEGPESYTVALTTPGTTTGAPVALGAANSVTTTITDANTTTWSLTGDTGVTEGNPASYTVHLAGTLQAGENASIVLSLTNNTTNPDGSDLATEAQFDAAVAAAVATYNAVPAQGTLSYDSSTNKLTFTSDGHSMGNLVINLTAVNDTQLEANEQYTVAIATPTTTTGTPLALGTTSVTTTIVDNDPAAGAPITLQVDEAALLTGSNPALTAEVASSPLSFSAAGFNLTSFAFSNDISGLVKDLNSDGTQDIFWVRDSGTQISGYLDAAHTVLADRLTLNAPSSIAAGATGSVTVTETLSAALKNPSGIGAQVSSLGNVGVVATDTNGDTATGTVNLNVKDDTPKADLVSTSIAPTDSKTNVMLILDLSGSMNDPSGLTGLSRLDVEKAAVNELLEQYDSRGDVMVRLVTFSDSATASGSAWMTVAAAKAALTGLTAGGNTNYDAGLLTTMSAFTASGALSGPGTQNVSYFLSDGVPTVGSDWPQISGTQTTSGIQTNEQAVWESFLTTNKIISYAFGVGSGVTTSTLDPIAFDPAPGTQLADTPIIVTNLSELTSALAFSVPPTSGAFVAGINGAIAGSFGADGGHIQSITVDGETYTFNPTTNTITPSGGGTPSFAYDGTTHTLTVDTDTSAVGGELAITMTTGAFTFQPTSSFTSESVGYVLVDNDGDTAGNTLTFTASSVADHAPIVRDDHVITNISGGSAAIAIPSSALLYNDADADGQAIAVTATSGASDGSVSPASGSPIATVTFTDNGNSNGGSFVYTGSTTSPLASDTGIVTVDRSQTGTTLTGTDFGEILIGRDGTNNAINANGGNDVLIGGAGNDTLNGGAGADMLTGGSGNDTFVFKAITDSQPGAAHFDTIIDFTHNSDHIDTTAIAGATIVQGSVVTASTVAANSISWFVDNAHNETIVYVNTTATANHVDMEIHLTGTNINLSGSDILHHA